VIGGGTNKEVSTMCNRSDFRAISLTAASLLIAACTGESIEQARLAESLGNAIREVGFSCDSVVSSHAINERGDVWRVACGAADVYAASLEASGDLCIEPVPFADAPVSLLVRPAQPYPAVPLSAEPALRAPAQPAGQRCTPGVDI
jgi:hypothetical protein